MDPRPADQGAEDRPGAVGLTMTTLEDLVKKQARLQRTYNTQSPMILPAKKVRRLRDESTGLRTPRTSN